MKSILVVFEKTKTGYSGYVEGTEVGIYSTGSTMPGCLKNMAEAWELYEKKDKKKSSKGSIQFKGLPKGIRNKIQSLKGDRS